MPWTSSPATHTDELLSSMQCMVRTLAAPGEGPARALVGRTRSEGMKLTGAVVCRSR
ncbi:hypothetical protein [Streptomyces mirabilis]|uniref:hypothetical protein n=1 Tax=Streptomyces mirabilis TaxID=68239 RepID=UPI003EBBFC60